MDENLYLLASVIGPCPNCGNGRLQAVTDGELTNFVCKTCGSCWHPELEWVNRINPATCPGCPERAGCLSAAVPFGAGVGA